jgi:hypothetical protein
MVKIGGAKQRIILVSQANNRPVGMAGQILRSGIVSNNVILYFL